MEYLLKKEGEFEYIEEGNGGPPLVLLHGLFGALSNWYSVLKTFSEKYTVYIPLLPVYKVSAVKPTLEDLTEYILQFFDHKGISAYALMGNSLGGHLGLMVCLQRPEATRALVLTGSSGLFESGMGSTFPRRGDFNYIRERVEFTFYAPETATRELVQEVFDIVNDRHLAIRVISIARAAQRLNMKPHLAQIKIPTCLIWGLNDNITPARVAHEFYRSLPNAELHFVDHCGHAPMMEQAQRFNELLSEFLDKRYLPVIS